MSKNGKIIVPIVIILLVLAIYLVLSLKEVTVQTKVPQSSEEFMQQVKENMEKIENQYKVDLKKIISEYEGLVNDDKRNEDELRLEITKTRTLILDLKVPAQYQDMHKSLVIAFSEAEDAESENFDESISEISSLINETKTSYSWLVD